MASSRPRTPSGYLAGPMLAGTALHAMLGFDATLRYSEPNARFVPVRLARFGRMRVPLG